MNRHLQTAFNKLQRKQVELNKTQLSLIDDIASEYQRFQDAFDDASYLAYEYADQVMDAYNDFRMKYPIDDFVINGNARDLEEITEIMQGYFDKLETQVQELGIDPESILPSYNDLKGWLAEAPSLNEEARRKYREATDYAGLPNFWD